MSDSFNPQELLSKLRAKSTSSTAASISNNSVAAERYNNGPSEYEQRSPTFSTNKAIATKNIRTPISLTLTPSQVNEYKPCYEHKLH
jgi:hypothetical protein